MNTSKNSQLFGQYMPVDIANYCILPYLGIHPEDMEEQRAILNRQFEICREAWKDWNYNLYADPRHVEDIVDIMNAVWADQLAEDFLNSQPPEVYCQSSKWYVGYHPRANENEDVCNCESEFDHHMKEAKCELVALDIRKKWYPQLEEYDCDKKELYKQIDHCEYEKKGAGNREKYGI